MKVWHRIAIGLVTVLTIASAVIIDGSSNVLARAVSLNSAFSALLTLTVFMFTARTFITFKLNEVVYGQPDYRKRVEELQAAGAVSRGLYEPLRELDETVGTTCLRCCVALFAVLGFSFLPSEWSKLGPPLVDSWKTLQSAPEPLPFSQVFPWRFVAYQVATIAVFSVIFCIIVEVFSAIIKVNQNVRSIIGEWENRYLKEKKALEETENASGNGP